MRWLGAPWSAVDDGHIPCVVALASGRREVVQPIDLYGAQLDAVGGRVLHDEGQSRRSITLIAVSSGESPSRW